MEKEKGGGIENTIRSKLLYERSLLKLRFGHDDDDDMMWFGSVIRKSWTADICGVSWVTR